MFWRYVLHLVATASSTERSHNAIEIGADEGCCVADLFVNHLVWRMGAVRWRQVLFYNVVQVPNYIQARARSSV